MEPSTPVSYIKGIGESRAKAFGKLGINTAYDLLCFFPRAYENRGNIKKLIECFDGESCSVVIKIDVPPKEGRGKSGIFYVKSSGSDDTDTLYLTFFNNKWISSSLVPGRLFRVYGKSFSPTGGKNPVASPIRRTRRRLSPFIPKPEALHRR